MTKEELKKEVEESAEKFFGKPTDLVDLDNLRIFKNGYLAGAEPRENKIADIRANCDLAIEGRDIKIKELSKENEVLKERYDRVDIIGYDALKNLTNAKDIIRALLFHLTDDTFYVTYETKEQSVERARQFLRGIKESDLQKENEQLKEQIEKMKCCGNCGNERCTSKYRGNSIYHTQTDGYACAENEDWVMRVKENG